RALPKPSEQTTSGSQPYPNVQRQRQDRLRDKPAAPSSPSGRVCSCGNAPAKPQQKFRKPSQHYHRRPSSFHPPQPPSESASERHRDFAATARYRAADETPAAPPETPPTRIVKQSSRPLLPNSRRSSA